MVEIPTSQPGTGESGVAPSSVGTAPPEGDQATDWWRTAVTYQIYIRSFADGDGDGIGDIPGIRQRLRYVAALGVDAIWINPWYPSPQADGGYDVADYLDIDPLFGDLSQAQALIDEAHALGLKVILDVVPNHTSDEHPWFQAALAAGPGSPERSKYIFRPGRGVGGDQPPNNWKSTFGGSAWQRVTEPDGSPGEWYLHLFDVKQPDLDWSNPQVVDGFLDILRFWFDRGADGFRIDVAHGMIKDPELPDIGETSAVVIGQLTEHDHPHWDRPEVHAIYRQWRALADSYDPPKMFVAEAWVSTPERLADYLRPDELHTAFDFEFVRTRWDLVDLRRRITSSLSAHDAVGAPVTWVLSNHDIPRHVTRFGRPGLPDTVDPVRPYVGGVELGPVDLALGTARARALLLLLLALPGAVYLYQGEELGLPEVEDLPGDLLQDPTWERSGFTERGRDGCRVPLPWARSGPSLGFGAGPGWLPQPPEFAALSVEAQDGDPSSMLSLYRAALRMRRSVPALGPDGGGLAWDDDPAVPSAQSQVLAFAREPGFVCVLNVGSAAASLSRWAGGKVLLSSSTEPLVDPLALPGNTAVWLSRGSAAPPP